MGRAGGGGLLEEAGTVGELKHGRVVIVLARTAHLRTCVPPTETATWLPMTYSVVQGLCMLSHRSVSD